MCNCNRSMLSWSIVEMHSDCSHAFIENMLYTLHATYIKHNLYADFSLRLERLLKEFSCDRFTVQDRLIASSWVIEIELSFRLVKTRFKSEFLTWVFKSNWDVRSEYLNWVRELKSSINLKFSIRLVKTWR